MNRPLIALFILAAGTCLYCALRHSTAELTQRTAETRRLVLAQTQALAYASAERTLIEEQVRELRHALDSQGLTAEPLPSDLLLSLPGTNHLPPAESEALLAELGFSWNTLGDYLVVSKETLRSVTLTGIRETKLDQAACEVLAITPEQRSAVEALLHTLAEAYGPWALNHLERHEPTGNIVAKYTLPADPGFAESLGTQLTRGLTSALGQERADYLLSYSSSENRNMGMFGAGPMGIYTGGPKTLSVTRLPNGQLHFEFESPAAVLGADVSPSLPFPEAFLPAFPNGWMGLAQREGFELPAPFDRKDQNPPGAAE